MKKFITVFVIFLMLFTPVTAQELGEFEESFQEEPEEDSDDEWDDEDDDWDDDDEGGLSDVLIELFVRLAWYMIVYGGAYSNDRMNPPEDDPDDWYVRPRMPGETLIPVFRSDTSLGIINPRLYCADQKFEAGYGAVSLSGRYSFFFETDRDADLHLWEAFIHYRMSISNVMELSPGFGFFGMEGELDYEGPSMVLPVRFHVQNEISVEAISAFNFYPSGAVGTDLDVGIMLDLGYTYPKAGYRRYGTESSYLNIFYLGCAVSY